MRGLCSAALAALLIPCVISVGSLGMLKNEATLSWRNRAGDELERIADGENSPTEMGQTAGSFRKAILISSPSPKIQKLSSLLDINDVLGSYRGQRIHRRDPAGCSHFWTEESTSCREITSENVVRRDHSISQFAIGLNNQIFGRSFAAVLPDRPKPPVILTQLGGTGFPIGVNSVRENEGLLICDKGFSRQDSLSSSGAPEGGREGRDNDSGKSGDRPIVLVNEVARTFGISTNQAKESGWVFFGGIALVVCLVMGDALFETWRKKSLARNKGRQKDS